MRYDQTERFGVIETNRIVTKDIGWIFREQPIVDVGLDAIIEESSEGEPKGKFIAVQIKSGRGNFHVSDKKITYYVSNIHYNYWLNLNIPIILIAHFPENEKTYWQHINKHNLKKTKKQWKLEIPNNQEFNFKAKNRLIDILSEKSCKSFVFELYKGKIEPDSIYDIAENVNCIADSVINVKKLIDFISELSENTMSFNSELTRFSKQGLTDRDFEVKASIKGFARQINISSQRIENEMIMFSKLYSEGFYAYEQVILLLYLFTNDIKGLDEAREIIKTIPDAINKALKGINSMRSGIVKLPNKFAVLKDAKMNFIEVIDLIINEYENAKIIAEKIEKNLYKSQNN